MRAEAFHLWLRPQHTESSAANRVSRVRRVEAAYGDLDQRFERDKPTGVLADLTYSTGDDQRKKPSPTPISIGGDLYRQLASLMSEEPERKVRGILVAGDFDVACVSAVRAVPAVRLKRYRFSFTFDDI